MAGRRPVCADRAPLCKAPWRPSDSLRATERPRTGRRAAPRRAGEQGSNRPPRSSQGRHPLLIDRPSPAAPRAATRPSAAPAPAVRPSDRPHRAAPLRDRGPTDPARADRAPTGRALSGPRRRGGAAPAARCPRRSLRRPRPPASAGPTRWPHPGSPAPRRSRPSGPTFPRHPAASTLHPNSPAAGSLQRRLAR